MLGYVTAEGRGAADKLLAELADSLHARGWPLAGVVQINRETRPDRHCDMDLCVLGHDIRCASAKTLAPIQKGAGWTPSGWRTPSVWSRPIWTAAPPCCLSTNSANPKLRAAGFAQ